MICFCAVIIKVSLASCIVCTPEATGSVSPHRTWQPDIAFGAEESVALVPFIAKSKLPCPSCYWSSCLVVGGIDPALSSARCCNTTDVGLAEPEGTSCMLLRLGKA